MVYVAFISLILGVVCGQWVFSKDVINIVVSSSDYILYILMLVVGISVGSNKGVFKKMKEYHFKIFIIPIGITIASVIAGAFTGFVLHMPIRESMAITSGMGWYSLSGVLLTDLAGPTIGTIAFLSNFLREIIAFLIIPWVARRFNYYTAIAPAAATSEDTTLSMLVKYTNEEVVVMAVFNGIICSFFVPILINLLL